MKCFKSDHLYAELRANMQEGGPKTHLDFTSNETLAVI